MGGGSSPAHRPPEVLDAVPVHVDLALSAAAGVGAAACVAPFVLTIDRAVTEFAAGQSTMAGALRKGTVEICKHPGRVLGSPALLMVVGVYGCTYAASNIINTISERRKFTRSQHTVCNLIGTTGTNMASSIAKDVAFARMFGGGTKSAAKAASAKHAQAMPKATIGLFAARDMLTVGAAFTVPPILASAIAANGVEPGRAATIAQFTAPPLMQVVCTPLHLMALDMYNEPAASTTQRLANIGRQLPSAIPVRMIRFFCAYGIGGNMNMWLTQSHRQWSMGRYFVPGQGESPPTLSKGESGLSAVGTMSPYVTAHAVLDWRLVLQIERHQVTEADIDRLFELADVGRTGALDEHDIVQIMDASYGSEREKHAVALRMIQVGDADRDGKVTREELVALLVAKKQQL